MYKNPTPTVDVIIELEDKIVLIERKNEPRGWALPGGFVDEGELLEKAAIREALEETSLQVTLTDLLYVYSHPSRDVRQHNLSVVYIAKAAGQLKAGDDAGAAELYSVDKLPQPLAFDHAQIIADYQQFKKTGERPTPVAMINRYE